jgi:cytochrome c oxidase cbb3-type subunit 2
VQRAKSSTSFGWQGASLVAITYVYFLIFAQFAFLKRLANLGVADAHLKAVMAAMAAGGIAMSLLAPRLRLWPAANLRLRVALAACAAAAWLAIFPLGFFAAVAVSLLIGAGLGLLTVTLVTHLRQWTGNRNPLLAVGAGTGVGYLICNLPGFFTARAEVQAMSAGILCLAGIGITVLPAPEVAEPRASQPQSQLSFYRVLGGFTALVWLDSAAFFIIQNNPALKAGTWQGAAHLWTNGFLHLAAALAGAWLLRRKGLSPVLTAAYLALGIACLLLLDPGRALLASVLYPVGVSLYSVALVAYPSLLAPAASIAERGRMAGWIYAIAGWTGSAMGIGMGQNLGHIPPAFVAAAGGAILLPLFPGFLRRRVRELSLTVLVMLMALYVDRILNAVDHSPQLTQIQRGRQVYISEGCIHCHSQYVRPNSPDVQMWGPVEPISEIRLLQPPLIGNRRQGPDLSEVGGRRSALWLKAHFFNPAQVSGASIMPSYGFLFRDRRGDDLVAYLESLRGAGTAQHLVDEKFWQPSAAAMAQANSSDGERLYQRDCATCHSADGPTRRAWKSSFKRLPPDLATGPYFYLPPAGFRERRMILLAQIAKFGIPATDMPGHEYLSDRDIASISLWLSQTFAESDPTSKTPLNPGEKE